MSETALVPTQPKAVATSTRGDSFTPEQIALIKNTIAVGATNDELQLFLAQCKRTGLDPFNRQIYAIKRGDKMTIQLSIDGLLTLAERTGQYRGVGAEQWCGSDGVWKDIWVSDKPPVAARVYVYREGFQPVEGKAHWAEYKQENTMWRKYPTSMLAKCALARSIRRAFPHDLSGLYTQEEMGSSEPMPIIIETPPPTNGNGKHVISNEEIEQQEIVNTRKAIAAYMSAHNITPTVAQQAAKLLGINKTSLDMNVNELEQILQALKDGQEAAPLPSGEMPEPPPHADEPLAPFTPPEQEPVPATTDEKKND